MTVNLMDLQSVIDVASTIFNNNCPSSLLTPDLLIEIGRCLKSNPSLRQGIELLYKKQHQLEKDLFEKRKDLEMEFDERIEKGIEKNLDEKTIEFLKGKKKKSLESFDKKVLIEFQKELENQQTFLKNFPGIIKTENEEKVEMQRKIMFIVRMISPNSPQIHQ